jgi:thiol-disulfide isomerase/thioredoxin
MITTFIGRPIEWKGKFAPDFEIRFLDGETFRLSENIGKRVIILNFFTTWCAACKAEIPELNRFYLNHKDGGLILVGINGGEKREVVKRFVVDEGIEFPVGIDEDLRIIERYRVKAYPTTVFIGVDGRVALYEIGVISNADIVFGELYRSNIKVLKEKGGVEREVYLEGIRVQNLSPEERTENLKGRAREFATRMICPSCGKRLVECKSKISKSIKEKLMKMELEDKPDEEILKEIFLEKR